MITTSTNILLNDIGENLRSLNSIISSTNINLQKLIKSNSSGFDFNTFISVMSGFIGVLIGALITYYFNKKLSVVNQKARFAVQRKNLIYSKLYKELLEVKGSLDSLPSNLFFFELDTEVVVTDNTHHYGEEMFYFDDRRYPTASFNVWKEMKSDIRQTLVPRQLKKDLNDLEITIITYFKSIEKFYTEAKHLEETDGKNMIKIYQNSGQNAKDSIFYLDLQKLFYDGIDMNQIVESNIRRYGFGDNGDLIKEINILISKIITLPSLIEIKTTFYNFKSMHAKVLGSLQKIVQDIVDKYEYGENL